MVLSRAGLRALVAGAVVVAGAGVARADDAESAADSGSATGFGLGGATTIGGVSGIEAVYWGERGCISLLAEGAHEDPDQGTAATLIEFSAGAFYAPLVTPRSRFAIGGRLDYFWLHQGDPVDDSAHQVALELPLRTEAWLTRHFSLHLEGGLLVELIGDQGDLLGNPVTARPKGTYLSLGRTSLLGSAGFTFYFQ